MNWTRLWSGTRQLVAAVLVLLILISVACACLCTPAASVSSMDDAAHVLLVGWAGELFGDPTGESIYAIEDASGTVFVLGRLGSPPDGSLVIVWGFKATAEQGRPLVVERRRAAVP